MKTKSFLIAALAISLASCGKSDEAPSAKPSAAAKTETQQVKYDPAFANIAGSWVSEAGALGEKKLLRIDIASGGGYTIDVRIPGKPEQVVESSRGTAKTTGEGSGVTAAAAADTKGATLKALGNWSASIDKEAKKMALTGADGKKVDLVWKGL
jgi:flagellar basal body L-ring protein FlgH